MLQNMNSGLNSKILRGLFGILLLSALLGLVMTDVGGFFRDGGFSRRDLAKVGNTELTVQQFDPLYRRQLQTAGMSPAQARQLGLPQMILQQEITRQTMLQAAKRVGINVDDKYVAEHLKKQLRFVPVPGSTKDKLQAILRNVDMTEHDFINAIKSDTAAQLLSNTISSQAKAIPAPMLNATNSAASQTRQAEIITLSNANLPNIKSPTDGDLKAYLDENKDVYQLPEQRNIIIGTIKQDNLISNITVSDDDAQAYYDENKDQFATPARVQFIQAIAPDQKTADAIYAAASKDGLKKAAADAKAQYSGSTWYEQPSLPDTLSKALYADKQKGQKTLLKPVQSPLGWHVMETTAYDEPKAKSFADVKSDIVDLLKQEQTDSALNKVVEDIENQAADGTSLDKIVEPYKGLTFAANGLTRQNAADKIAELKLPEDANANVLDAAFSLNEDDNSPIIESKKGTYLLVHIDKVDEPHIPSFDLIKPKLTADWLAQQRDTALDKAIDDVIADYDSKKPALGTIAEKHKAPYRQTAYLSRDNQDLPAEVMNVLFNLSPHNDLTSVKTKDGAMIVRLSGIKTVPSTDLKITDKQSEDMRTAVAQELQQQFIMGWRDYLGVDINKDMLMKTYLQAAKDEN